MPLKVTFELSDRDLHYFRDMMSEVADRCSHFSGEQIIANASATLGGMDEDAPEFIRLRAVKLRSMIEMLEDEEWNLEGTDRDRVIKALSYFAEPHDLIPDAVPGIGFLDDAIMVELVVRELVHELDAYDDFCRFRSQKDKVLRATGQGATHREEWLDARRKQLQARMNRRRKRRHRTSSRSAPSQRSPYSLW